MNELINVEKVAQWQKLKTLVLDSVSSPITKRVYNMALDEFMGWFQEAPRLGFTKATVSAWRVSLEDRKLGSSSIIVRMSAIRKLAAEAADNGILAVLLGCGLRRSEVAALLFTHLQQRDGRWCIVDLVGKHGRVRTAPMPTWVKVAIDAWSSPAGLAEGYVFRSVNRGDRVMGESL